MRFIMMHKNDPHSEAGLPPSKQIIDDMGAFIGEFMKSGKFLDGAGLLGSKARTRLVFRGGECTTKRGPYKGEHELPAKMLFLETRTLEEALGWAERYGKILGDGEIELGKVTEPWDLGVVPAPANPPLHYMLIEKADKQTESGGRSPQVKAALSRLETEMSKAGVLQRGYGLKPSSDAKRLTFTNNELRVVDGPFAESRELIGGLSVMELSGYEEVIELCKRYAKILGGTLEIDLRVVDQG